MTAYCLDTDVVGGDGSGSDWDNAFASLSAANSYLGSNNITEASSILCIGTAADTSTVIWNGTGADTYQLLIVGYWEAGIYSALNFRQESTTGHLNEIEEAFMGFVSVQFKQGNTSSYYYAVDVQPSAAFQCFIDKCILDANGGRTRGFYAHSGDAGSVMQIENTIAFGAGSGTDGQYLFVGNDSDVTMNATNVTLYGYSTGRGVSNDGGTLNLKNSLVFGNSDDISGTVNITYSCGDDSDFSSGTGNFQITQTADNYAALVKDASGGDFSITNLLSELYNTGTNTGAPSDDIVGSVRPLNGITDIGAFELIVLAKRKILNIRRMENGDL